MGSSTISVDDVDSIEAVVSIGEEDRNHGRRRRMESSSTISVDDLDSIEEVVSIGEEDRNHGRRRSMEPSFLGVVALSEKFLRRWNGD